MEQDKLDTLLVTQVLILSIKMISQSRERILQMLIENRS